MGDILSQHLRRANSLASNPCTDTGPGARLLGPRYRVEPSRPASLFLLVPLGSAACCDEEQGWTASS
eukprot:scaffold489812_cov47-Prasinocladus_malaysianus.AAC.1